MNWIPYSIKEEAFSPFAEFGDRWALLSAGTEDAWNTMTVSWGQVGVLWGKNVATIYVRPQRYTHTFIENCDRFSLSFFPESARSVLSYCGKYSGRDVNKAAATGLSPTFDQGAVFFDQAERTIVCRKLYCQRLDPGCFIDKECDRRNYHGDYHDMYIGEIIGSYRAEK